MIYITTCKNCGEVGSRLRASYMYTTQGESIRLPSSSVLEENGLPPVTFGDHPPKTGDEIEVKCTVCGAASNLDEYAVHNAETIAVPDVEALRSDINAMLDTARFAPRPPVFEPKPKTKPCKSCEDGCRCDTYEEAPEDGYCECQGCDGCDSCACCCTCNNDEGEPTEDDDHTDDDGEPDGIVEEENNIRQAEVRNMEEPRFLRLRDSIVRKLNVDDMPDDAFYTVCDWQNQRHWSFSDTIRATEKFLDIQSSDAELFVERLRIQPIKQRVAAWNDRVLNID